MNPELTYRGCELDPNAYEPIHIQKFLIDEEISQSARKREGLKCLKEDPELYELAKIHFEKRLEVMGANILYHEWKWVLENFSYQEFCKLWESGDLAKLLRERETRYGCDQFFEVQPFGRLTKLKAERK